MDERSINVELAGRAYPLTINVAEEENVRKAVNEINESIARLKASYPLTDKQDLLAMASLEVAVRALNTSAPRQEAATDDMLTAIERLLSDRRV
jgi:cell division protein ZapA (FtsZ GTPase activity inhibitor)